MRPLTSPHWHEQHCPPAARCRNLFMMVNRYNMIEAIGRFNNWSQPWTFRPSVAAALDQEGAELFERVWFAATDASHWTVDHDLQRCAERASSVLQSRFPELNEKAAQAIARAASYEWR